MPNETTLTTEYINSCRQRMDAQIECYNQLVAAARDEYTTNEVLDETIQNFEPVFFNNLLLVMEGYFGAQLPTGAAGNKPAIQEVRLMCHAIRHHHNQLGSEYGNAINPETSVLKLETGSTVRLNETNFITLSKAFFGELEDLVQQQ